MSFSVEAEFLKSGLALVGALVGSYIGARHALRRFKHERAHDKRLEWHLAALSAIHDLQAEMRWAGRTLGERPAKFRRAAKRFARVYDERNAFMIKKDADRLYRGYQGFFKATVTAGLDGARGEDEQTISQVTRFAREQIAEAESAILGGLARLMPIERGARFDFRVLRRFRGRQRRKARTEKLRVSPRRGKGRAAD